MNNAQQNDAPEQPDTAVEQLIAEIRLLVDHVSSTGGISLEKLETDNPYGTSDSGGPPDPKKMSSKDILLRLEKIRKSTQLNESDFTFLQLTRDALSRLVRPASNLTVAYTTLVTQGGKSGKSLAKVGLAEAAYPNLTATAKWHRASNVAFLMLAIVVTYWAVHMSVRVATGKYVLQTLDALYQRRTTLMEEEGKIERSRAQSLPALSTLADLFHADGKVDIRAFRVCDQPKMLARLATRQAEAIVGTNSELSATADLLGKHLAPGGELEEPIAIYPGPEERKHCGQDDVLKADFVIAHETVDNWDRCGSTQLGDVFYVIDDQILGLKAVTNWILGYGNSDCPIRYNKDNSTETRDVELKISPRILALGNYLLPVAFGLLGSVLYVVLENRNKIASATLLPSDIWLSWIRLVLGVVIGASIGLFFTSYAPTTPPPANQGGSALISSLSLSASGLAFLAGFGVEGVFTMLQQLVGRVFSLNDPAQKS